ncbi:uncharacterized protein [Argopecten irradians]|uniref:uncharacterized protein n=1 Tax=Argopecten irradians TaxID=31199 RepID=UPI00372049DB
MAFFDTNSSTVRFSTSAFLLVIIVLVYLPDQLESIKAATFSSLRSILNNTRIDTNLTASITNIRKLPCMSECLNNVNCMSAGYHSNNTECRLHSVLDSGSSGVPETGWEYFSIQEDFCRKENFVHNRILDICYSVEPGLKNCPDAMGTCASIPASLLTVDSQEKQDWLQEVCVANNITGVYFDMYKDGVWKLRSTGMTPSYTNWDDGQPDSTGTDVCVASKPNFNWMWHDYPYPWKAGIICEIRRP